MNWVRVRIKLRPSGQERLRLAAALLHRLVGKRKWDLKRAARLTDIYIRLLNYRISNRPDPLQPGPITARQSGKGHGPSSDIH